MNYKKITSYLGNILIIEGLLLVFPVLISLFTRDKIAKSFLVTIALLIAVGFACIKIKPDKSAIYAKEGCFIVGVAWILMSAFGALPFYLSGYIPSYIDAFFETVSGFTTTGSTILTDVEALPKSLLFWRSFTHFIGGMGILVFIIAIMPKTEGSSMHIMRAEVPGPTVGKLVSKIGLTARILYGIYFGMTVIMAILLYVGGMPLFDSVVNAFATAGTGGFGILNEGISGYNSVYCEMVIAVFMMLFGVNFNLYYLLGKRQIKRAVKNEELWWYLGIIAIATLLIAAVLFAKSETAFDSFRLAFFQVTSIISTTGFATADFNGWPLVTRMILFCLMFVGGMVGSTGGGLKVNRIIIIVKNSFRSVKKAMNPRVVDTVKIDNQTVEEPIVSGVSAYVCAFSIILLFSAIVVSLDGHTFQETISGVVTCITNVGPGFGVCGPCGSFASFSPLSKAVLSFDMLAGRLELVPILMLFTSKK